MPRNRCSSLTRAAQFYAAATRSTRRILAKIVGIRGTLLEVRIAAPFQMARGHVGAVSHPEQQRALRPVDVFLHLAGRMDAERSWHDIGGAGGQAHLAAARKAEIDFGAVRMAVVRADLAGLPARHCV